MGWIDLAQDSDRRRVVVNAIINLRVQYNARNFLTCCKPVSFSRRTPLHGVSKEWSKVRNVFTQQFSGANVFFLQKTLYLKNISA
jgi:hypothetical protein